MKHTLVNFLTKSGYNIFENDGKRYVKEPNLKFVFVKL